MNNYSGNCFFLYFSHTHCVHDLSKHIQTAYVTNLIALQLNRSHPQLRIFKRSHTQSLYSGDFFVFLTESLFLRASTWCSTRSVFSDFFFSFVLLMNYFDTSETMAGDLYTPYIFL